MKFRYNAQDRDGKRIEGSMEAASPEEVAETMRKSGLVPIDVQPETGDSEISPGTQGGRRKLGRLAIALVLLVGVASVVALPGLRYRVKDTSQLAWGWVLDRIRPPETAGESHAVLAQMERLLRETRDQFPTRTVICHADAERHVGEEVLVVGPVVNFYTVGEKVNLRFDLAQNGFCAQCSEAVWHDFPEASKCVKGKIVRVAGKVCSRGERVVLEIQSCSQCKVLEDIGARNILTQ